MSAGRAERRRLARQMGKVAPELGLSTGQWQAAVDAEARSRRTGDGQMAVRSTGFTQEARPMGQMPAKVPGEHRWVATGAWYVGESAVVAAADPGVEKHLDNENLLDISFGCWDCEQPLGCSQSRIEVHRCRRVDTAIKNTCKWCDGPAVLATVADIDPTNYKDAHRGDEVLWRHDHGGTRRPGSRRCAGGAEVVEPRD